MQRQAQVHHWVEGGVTVPEGILGSPLLEVKFNSTAAFRAEIVERASWTGVER